MSHSNPTLMDRIRAEIYMALGPNRDETNDGGRYDHHAEMIRNWRRTDTATTPKPQKIRRPTVK